MKPWNNWSYTFACEAATWKVGIRVSLCAVIKNAVSTHGFLWGWEGMWCDGNSKQALGSEPRGQIPSSPTYQLHKFCLFESASSSTYTFHPLLNSNLHPPSNVIFGSFCIGIINEEQVWNSKCWAYGYSRDISTSLSGKMRCHSVCA